MLVNVSSFVPVVATSTIAVKAIAVGGDDLEGFRRPQTSPCFAAPNCVLSYERPPPPHSEIYARVYCLDGAQVNE
jgi:hypothetical protein